MQRLIERHQEHFIRGLAEDRFSARDLICLYEEIGQITAWGFYERAMRLKASPGFQVRTDQMFAQDDQRFERERTELLEARKREEAEREERELLLARLHRELADSPDRFVRRYCRNVPEWAVGETLGALQEGHEVCLFCDRPLTLRIRPRIVVSLRDTQDLHDIPGRHGHLYIIDCPAASLAPELAHIHRTSI